MDTAVAVHPEATYVLAERDGEKIVTAEPLVPEGAEILERRTGAEDLEIARRHGLPVVNPIGVNGHFLAEVPLIGGLFFRDANDSVIAELTDRGLLAKHEPYPHSYPWVPAWPAVRRSR